MFFTNQVLGSLCALVFLCRSYSERNDEHRAFINAEKLLKILFGFFFNVFYRRRITPPEK